MKHWVPFAPGGSTSCAAEFRLSNPTISQRDTENRTQWGWFQKGVTAGARSLESGLCSSPISHLSTVLWLGTNHWGAFSSTFLTCVLRLAMPPWYVLGQFKWDRVCKAPSPVQGTQCRALSKWSLSCFLLCVEDGGRESCGNPGHQIHSPNSPLTSGFNLFHSFIQQTDSECLLYARCCSKCWEYNSEENRQNPQP